MHPFEDGNGRIGRATMQLAMGQDTDHSLQRIQFQASVSQQALNERQLKTMKKLLDAGPKGYIGGMTTRKHAQISKTSSPTATRDLIDLEQRGLYGPSKF